MTEPNSKRQIALPLLLSIAVASGILIGIVLSDVEPPNQDVQSSTNKFGQVLNLIDRNYVDTVDSEQLVEHAITQMLEKLDPHTTYIPRADQEIAQSKLEQDFEGVGVEFTIVQDTLFVISAIPGGPSEKAGIKAGDKIVSVNENNITGTELDSRKIFTQLRGKKGSKVNVGVIRKGEKEKLTFTVTRDKIPTFAIGAAVMVDGKTGYIQLDRFSKGAHDEFVEAVRTLKKEGMERLIFDLRDNGGGYLDEATEICDELLQPGKLIVYTKGKSARFDQEYRAERRGIFEKGKLIVLINENSASASEILAGAMQDNDRALIVGRRSFGKGLVQKPILLVDESELRLTISRYYTPSDRCIQRPYQKEGEDYDLDYLKRLESGELFSEDSVQVNDSLKFKTVNGRIVYGGGGVLPDFFIPKDTTGYSNFLGSLYTTNTLREFSIYYANDNQERLKQLGLTGWMNRSMNGSVVKALVSLAEKNGITPKSEEVTRSKSAIEDDFRALVARNIWGKNAYFEVKNQNDPFIRQSLKVFPKADVMLGWAPTE